jgi:hypothetical protein
MIKKTLKNISAREVESINREIIKNDNLFVLSLEDIGKLFLQKFIEEDIFVLSFKDIRDQFIISSERDKNDIPKDKEKFFIYICEKYLSLGTEPRVHLLELYRNASEDLKQIEININKYEQEIKLQKQKGDNFDEVDNYKIPMLEYFIKMNIKAKDEIIFFINSEDIKFLAIEKSKKKLSISITFPAKEPYPYRHYPERYDIDKFSEIRNKFFWELAIDQLYELEELYKNDQPTFFNSAQEHIINHNIIDSIYQKIDTNHCLNARKNVLLPALEFYNSNKKILFLNLIALQIEGIFYDYCLELGISKQALRQASIGAKLDEINSRNPELFDFKLFRFTSYAFEYFKFHFPLLRNKVAHGKLINLEDQECDNLACLLLLDLNFVCNLIVSYHLPVNLLVEILKKIKSGKHEISDFVKIKYTIFYEENKTSNKNLLEEKVLEFYHLNDTLKSIKGNLIEDPFFDYLSKVIDKGDPVAIHGINKMITAYKQNKIREDKCRELIIKIYQLNTPKPKDTDIRIVDFFNAIK